MHLTAQQKKLAKWIGYPLLVLVTFLFSLQATFPYERLEDRIIGALDDKYDVTIQSIEPSLVPGSFTINSMYLRSRPTSPEQEPVELYFKEINVDIGVISGMFWSIGMARVGVEVDAMVSGGELSLEAEHDKSTNTIAAEIHTKRLPIGGIPGITQAVGLPMTGGLNLDVEVELEGGKWSKANGSVELKCIACTVGDGVAKLKMKPRPGQKVRQRALIFQGDGVTVPRINLGVVAAKVDIGKGKGEIKSFSARSDDGFLNVEGTIDFKDPFKDTVFPGCIKFGFSDELKAKEPKFMGIEAGLPPQSRQDDGSYALPMKGKLANLRVNKRGRCGDAAGSDDGDRERPRITTTARKDKPTPREMPKLNETTSDDDEVDDKDEGDEIPTESGPRINTQLRRADDDETFDDEDDDERDELDDEEGEFEDEAEDEEVDDEFEDEFDEPGEDF